MIEFLHATISTLILILFCNVWPAPRKYKNFVHETILVKWPKITGKKFLPGIYSYYSKKDSL